MTNKIVTAPNRPSSVVTVKNIHSLPTINMTNKGELASVKVQQVTRNNSLPVFVTKTSEGITVLNSNRPVVQASTSPRIITAKPNDVESKAKFNIISPNRSLLVNDKLQKSNSPVAQIVRLANTNSE